MVILAGAVVTPCLPPPRHQCGRPVPYQRRAVQARGCWNPAVARGSGKAAMRNLLEQRSWILHMVMSADMALAPTRSGCRQVVHHGGIGGLDVAAPKLRSPGRR